MFPAEQLLGQVYPPEVSSERDESLEVLPRARECGGSTVEKFRGGRGAVHGGLEAGSKGWGWAGVWGPDAALSTSDLSGKTLYEHVSVCGVGAHAELGGWEKGARGGRLGGWAA